MEKLKNVSLVQQSPKKETFEYSQEYLDAVGSCLMLICGLRNQPTSEAQALAFKIGLKGLTPKQIADGTEWVLKHDKGFPTPGRIRDAVQAAFERMGDTAIIERSEPKCRECGDCGWKIAPHHKRGTDPYYEDKTEAVRCKHEQ